MHQTRFRIQKTFTLHLLNSKTFSNSLRVLLINPRFDHISPKNKYIFKAKESVASILVLFVPPDIDFNPTCMHAPFQILKKLFPLRHTTRHQSNYYLKKTWLPKTCFFFNLNGINWGFYVINFLDKIFFWTLCYIGFYSLLFGKKSEKLSQYGSIDFEMKISSAFWFKFSGANEAFFHLKKVWIIL